MRGPLGDGGHDGIEQTARESPVGGGKFARINGERIMLRSVPGGCVVVDTYPPNIPPKIGASRGDWEPVRGTALTERQRQALEAIRESVRERGMAPTHTELAKAMKLPNASAVSGYIAALARKSWDRGSPLG